MHRIVASILGLLLLVAPSFASLPVRVVLLEGSPYQRGITHGQTLKEQIHAVLRLWKAELQQQYRTDAETFVKTFLLKTDYVPASGSGHPNCSTRSKE